MATVTLTGKTFEHRQTLLDMAGRWNPANKTWTLRGVSPERMTELKSWAGVNVVSLPEAGDLVAARKIEGDTKFYGDDDRYFNQFAKRDPRVFAGFNSFDALINFIEALPTPPNGYDNRARAWDIGTKFFDSYSMSEAIKLARNGWQIGVTLAKAAMEIIEADHATARKRIYDVAGGCVNVGKMLSGSPVHMTRRARQPAHKVITLYVELVMASSITPENAALRAASIAAMADLLEASDYSCEIIGVMTFARGEHYTGPAECHVTVNLKQAGETLNLNNLVFALGHASMLRRFGFAIMAVDYRLRSNWHSMGKISNAFVPGEHDPEPNSFYIEKLDHYDRAKVTGTFENKVRALFSLIVPDNFPVSLK